MSCGGGESGNLMQCKVLKAMVHYRFSSTMMLRLEY